MIYFLHGPDTFRSRQKLREIISEFEKKTGAATGMTRIDVSTKPETVFEVGRTGSLFSQKELVVIENASAGSREGGDYLRGRLKDWAGDRDRTIVFWEGEVKTDEGFMAAIAKAAVKTQEFRPLSSSAVSRWLYAAAAERKVQVSGREKEMLIAKHGSDLWAISNELDKIAAGWTTSHDIREEEKIWSFTDAFFQHPRRSFRPLSEFLQAGYEPIYLVGALASSLRTLALVWWGMTAGKLKAITRGLHPFVVRKNSDLAKRTNARQLSKLFDRLITADIEQKTGRLPPPLPLIKLVLGKAKSKTPD